MKRRMLAEYGATRTDSNFGMVFSIGAHSYSHGLDASDLFRQNMYLEKSTRVRVVCIQDHGPLWRAPYGLGIIGLLCTVMCAT